MIAQFLAGKIIAGTLTMDKILSAKLQAEVKAVLESYGWQYEENRI